jgi:methylenetetrahydrofolate dehydrogenase (NAD+)
MAIRRYANTVNKQISDCSLSVEEVLSQSDVVITGVPSASYKLPLAPLKDGVVAINFSFQQNIPDEVRQKASIFVGSVGKVTVSMLFRNLVRLAAYQRE